MNPEIPGGALPERQLFEQKVHLVDGRQKVVGFNSPDGKYYPLEEGEELVHIKSESGSGRDTFIRKDGQEIPFDEWKEEFLKEIKKEHEIHVLFKNKSFNLVGLPFYNEDNRKPEFEESFLEEVGL